LWDALDFIASSTNIDCRAKPLRVAQENTSADRGDAIERREITRAHGRFHARIKEPIGVDYSRTKSRTNPASTAG